jgi:hypothetical protein
MGVARKSRRDATGKRALLEAEPADVPERHDSDVTIDGGSLRRAETDPEDERKVPAVNLLERSTTVPKRC